MTREVLVYAHRGAPAEQPENTLPSFRRALDLGADVLEMDVHLTSDGHVVVSHDETGGRMARVAREIRHASLDEVQRWDAGWGFLDDQRKRPFVGQGYRIPTIEQVLREFPGVKLNIDAKQREPPMVEPLLRALRAARAEPYVRIASFHGATLREVRRHGWEGETGLAQTEVARLVFMPRMLLRVSPPAGQAAQVPTRVGKIALATRRFVEKCHALAIRVDFWTIDDPAAAIELLELGADGIMTDDPRAVARPVRAWREARSAVPRDAR